MTMKRVNAVNRPSTLKQLWMLSDDELWDELEYRALVAETKSAAKVGLIRRVRPRRETTE